MLKSRPSSLASTLAACLALFALTPTVSCDNPAASAVEPIVEPEQQPSQLVVSPKNDTIAAVGATLQLTATVLDSQGQSVSGGAISWQSFDTTIVSVSDSGLVTGVRSGSVLVAASAGSLADTAAIVVAEMPDSLPRLPQAHLTPAALVPIIGPLVLRGSAPTPETLRHDQRYLSTEGARFSNYLACTSGCITTANHYGGLRSRLMWAIRNAEPIGPAAIAETFAYGRGRSIILTYLAYSKKTNFATQPHNNTGLADVEAYYVLEGDSDAYNHIWVTAAMGTQDRFGYTNCQNSNSDARGPTIGIQSMSAAHRLRIPHSRPPANGSISTDMSRGSWLADGKWVIDRVLAGCVKADGSVPSPAHGGQEAYLFNGMLAATLLQWHGFVEPNAAAFDAVRRIMDHLITLYETVHKPKGWSTLPYTTHGTYAAEDLAGYYVWPSIVLWQETGDVKYREFAVSQIASMNRTSSISGLKQWNQMYSTQAQSAETLLSGVRWKQ